MKKFLIIVFEKSVGKYKKTILEVPSKLVRPTAAFKREAIFSILESYSIKNSIEIYKKKSITFKTIND